ncbi:MAG: DUF4251 domain-containing protein [Agriterribacter sp.]
MKVKLNNIIAGYLFTFFVIIYGGSGCSSTKHTDAVIAVSKEETVQAINNDRWIFVVNQIVPQAGRTRTATSRYDVRSSKDTVAVQLPYFGRAYSGAAIMDNTSPLNFTSTDFDRSKDEGNNGKWNITIKPRDNREVQSMNFTLYDNGSAQLNVQLTNRSPISFSGSVMPGK